MARPAGRVEMDDGVKLNRRQALAALGAAPTVAVAPKAMGQARVRPTAPTVAFPYGVASGDPLADRVILWTRTEGRPGDIGLDWEVAADAGFARIVARGVVVAEAARGHSAKVDATGLSAGTDYWYRFRSGSGARAVVSPVGRTKTLPVGSTRDVVLAVASCCLYPGGYFNAYQAIADLPRVDAVVHLGDYIYENACRSPADYAYDIGAKIGRISDPDYACVTLDDYRRRYAQARRDAQLQAAHARAPFISVWDDHDICNDAWMHGGQAHNPLTDGSWVERKAAALQAFYEWQPVREPAAGQLREASWRSFRFGDVASLSMIESRLVARAQQLTYARDLPTVNGEPDVAAFRRKLDDPARDMLGQGQGDWLAADLAAHARAGVAWQVLGNEVVAARVANIDIPALLGPAGWAEAPLSPYYRGTMGAAAAMASNDALPFNLDAWDGYPAARERFFQTLLSSGARPIVLSADSHMFWVNQLHTASGVRVAPEFSTTAISSPGYADGLNERAVGEAFVKRNPEVLFNAPSAKGFILLTLTKAQARAELRTVSTVTETAFTKSTMATYAVEALPNGAVGEIHKI